jgi:hypothetical protein
MDPLVILQASAIAALVSASVVLILGRPWAAPVHARATASCVLGVGLGFVVGCWLLGVRPNWPPGEDQDRFLLILFPAVFVVELLVSFPGQVQRLAWPLRILIAAAAGRLLLHRSTFITDLGVEGTPEWTTTQGHFILGGMAVALVLVWAALAWLVHPPATKWDGLPPNAPRPPAPNHSVPLALVLTCAAAAVTVMLSGYASGGQLGLPLAASLLGAVAASWLFQEVPDVRGIVGLAIVGLFALVVVGRFFGTLSTINAILLFFGPVLCWMPELPQRFRGLARVMLTGVPVAVAVVLTQAKFIEDSNRPSSGTKQPAPTAPGTREPSWDDYLDFRK